MQWKSVAENVLGWSQDPVIRQRLAMQRAEQRGIARMMEPLRRALDEADALGIQFYGNRLVEYLQVVETVTPTLATLPSLNLHNRLISCPRLLSLIYRQRSQAIS